MRNIFISTVVIFSAGLEIAVAQDPPQPVGPSAQWCKDRTIHQDQPTRYRVIKMQVGDADNPQVCMELLDTQQMPVCRVKYECSAT
jgi:hypothetical protein